jgi:hypothetical protein
MGAMIKMLGGNAETVTACQSSLGKTISRVRCDGESDLRIDFADGTGLLLTDEGQSCCEHRYMRTDDDLNYYEGATLLDLEIADAPSVEAEYETHDVQFLNVKTSKGVFVMSNHNEHNGYYGGFYIAARTYAVSQ